MTQETKASIRGVDGANITEDKQFISDEHVELDPDNPPSWRRREKFGKRTNFDIRIAIINTLKIYPMGIEELSSACKAHYSTVEKHVAWLEAIGIVQRLEISYQGKNYVIWKLNK